MFPNPVDGKIQIEFSGAGLVYSIFSIDGRTLKSGYLERNTGTIDISDLGAGVYMINIVCEGIPDTQKIIIQK